MKTLLYALITAACLAAFAPAQEPLMASRNEARRIAEQIDNGHLMMIRSIEMQLNAFYRQVNTAGKQQAILDAFGTKAVAAMEKYIKMRAALLELNPNADVTVTYVAPPIVVTPPAP